MGTDASSGDEKGASKVGAKPAVAASTKRKGKNEKKQKAKKYEKIVLTTHSKGLSKAQIDYETKVNPKHFKPLVMKKRMQLIAERVPQLTAGKKKKKGKNGPQVTGSTERQTSIDKQNKTKDSSAFKQPLKDISVVTSFTDWMPIAMKTQRTLVLEQTAPDKHDEIAEHLFEEDDTIMLYARMAPPGYHYFYFVKE
jgi:hypothetical protein